MIYKALSIAILSSTPILANAYDLAKTNNDGKTIYYSLIDDNTLAVTYKDKYLPTADYQGVLNIPSSIIDDNKEYTVAAIDDRAFFACSDLESVIMPSTIQSIGMWAFAGCDNIEAITIPEAVSSIGANVFDGCFALNDIKVDKGNNSFTSINDILYNKQGNAIIAYPAGRDDEFTLPEYVTDIAEMAFYGCSFLKAITLPEGLLSIGDNAFYFCNDLKSVEIPASVVKIGKTAFADCFSLTAINVSDDNNNYASHSGVLFDKELKSLIQTPAAFDGAAVIPSSTTSIEAQALLRCYGITTAIIPEGVTHIGEAAFADCRNMSALSIPSSVKVIEPLAFAMCNSLKSVHVFNERPDTVYVGEGAFSGINSAESVLYVPYGSSYRYADSQVWGEFDLIIECDDRQPQSIIWETEYNIKPDSQTTIQLDAFATSDLAVKYILSPLSQPFATLDGNELTLLADGKVIVTAIQDGNYHFLPAQPVTRTIVDETEGITDVSTDCDIRVYAQASNIIIKGAPDNALAYIYDIAGRCIYSGLDRQIPVERNNIYMVRIGNNAFKVFTR